MYDLPDKLDPDGDSRDDWKAVNQVREWGKEKVEPLIEEARCRIRRLEGETGGGASASVGFYPFEIYQSTFTTADEEGWREVVVRAGRVWEVQATGTDGANDDPYASDQPDPGGNVIVVDDNEPEYYIWLDITIDDTDTITDVAVDDGSEWPPTPVTGHTFWLLGTVDTSTDSETEVAHIRQLWGGGDVVPAEVIQTCRASDGTFQRMVVIGSVPCV